jgi:hypothetical protein
MKYGRVVLQLSLAWVALVAAQIVAGIPMPSMPVAPHAFPWMLASNALFVFALAPAAMRAPWRGWRLYLALVAIPVATTITNAIEGIFFLTHLNIRWTWVVAYSILSNALAMALWLVIFRRVPRETPAMPSSPQLSPGTKFRDFALCDFAHLCLYFIAGMIVWPFIRDFYAGQSVPPFWKIAALQFFFRGPVFVLLCILLLRMYRLTGIAGALAVGAAWALFNGALPLLVPNAYFPDSVRWAHLIETTSSNFLFGMLTGWLWGRTSHVRQVDAVAHAG